ncbi:MAG: hypothetical protein WD052_05270 [Bacteroidales bacterium]
MKSKLIIGTLCLVLAGSSSLMAQEAVERIWRDIDSINSNVQKPTEVLSVNPWRFNTTVGTSLAYYPAFGSATNMFVAPHATYAAGNRLSFHGGIMASHTIPAFEQYNSEMSVPSGITSMSVFVSASYRISENLVVHGTGIKDMAMFPLDQERSNMNFQDLSLGATYNFGNFSIGASIHRSDHSRFSSPFGYGNNMYYSPFYW